MRKISDFPKRPASPASLLRAADAAGYALAASSSEGDDGRRGLFLRVCVAFVPMALAVTALTVMAVSL